MPIALYHCSIKIISRGKGKSAVAAAAYRSGEKITNERDGEIHDYTKKGGGNPHAHVMLTMRPFSEGGKWGTKQKKEYILDENGAKIYDPIKRQYECNSIPTTDWNEHSKAEEWRAAWADCVNAALEKNGHTERVDHRSYERQGIDQIPTIHLGVAASQMEKRGIRTERGDINREIEVSNQTLRQLKARIGRPTFVLS